MLRTGSYLAIIGEENVFDTKGSAIAQITARLDRRLCENCDRRTFEECRRAS
jgi:hypothetical protein